MIRVLSLGAGVQGRGKGGRSMKLRNTRDRLAVNMKIWRINMEKGLRVAAPDEYARIQSMIADFVLIEKALLDPWSTEIECEYQFPEGHSGIVAPRRQKSPRLIMPGKYTRG